MEPVYYSGLVTTKHFVACEHYKGEDQTATFMDICSLIYQLLLLNTLC